MHTELDEIDLAIINSLMKDGRKSFRQIAREIKVSTPTVEFRFCKMKKDLGIIKNIQPIIDTDKLDNSNDYKHRGEPCIKRTRPSRSSIPICRRIYY